MLYFIGGAGNGNFGDELIVSGWIDYLSEQNCKMDVIFDENYVKISRRFFNSVSPNITFSEDLSNLKRKGPKDFVGSLIRGIRFYENGGFDRHPELIHLNDIFPRVKVLHLHGGGYINTIWPTNAFLLGFAAATKRRFGCKIVGTGLGILPAAKPPAEHLAAFRDAIAAFDVLEVRDRWAFDYLKKISDSPRILSGLDDTYLLRRESGPTSRPRTLHYSFFSSANNFDRLLSFAAGPEPKAFERIIFWSCTNQDAKCYEQIAAVCPRTELVSWEDLVHGPLPVGVGDFMITARFHPHLLAARYGAYGAFRKDSGYYDVKHGSVVDLGSPFVPMDGEITSVRSGDYFSSIYEFDTMRVAIKRTLAEHIYGEILTSTLRTTASQPSA
jgi:hypothetical protein